LGKEQLAWLDTELARRPDKPALVVAHHNPDVRQNTSGLTDTKALFDVLRPRRQVKAYLFGHTHHWDVRADDDGIQLVNLPPVAYVFRQGNPSGWVDARLTAAGMSLQLNCVDPEHPQHGQTIELTWRA
jgi:3',5'-cyclic AMP phosphodiesterase CpdA